MVRLYEAGTDRLCGTLTDRQFEILAEAIGGGGRAAVCEPCVP